MSTITRRIIPAIAVAGTMMLVATGCVAGENATASDASTDDAAATGEWSSHSAPRTADAVSATRSR